MTHSHKPTIGCYVDGAYQNQLDGDARSVRLSESFGRILDRETENFCRRVELDCATGRDLEISEEFSDEARDWLNENACLPYCSWYWHEGDFRLWPIEISEVREQVGFCSVRSLAEAQRLGIATDPDDSAFPPADYRGEWLHVSDHGNCTLYVREDDGSDREVWSVV